MSKHKKDFWTGIILTFISTFLLSFILFYLYNSHINKEEETTETTLITKYDIFLTKKNKENDTGYCIEYVPIGDYFLVELAEELNIKNSTVKVPKDTFIAVKNSSNIASYSLLKSNTEVIEVDNSQENKLVQVVPVSISREYTKLFTEETEYIMYLTKDAVKNFNNKEEIKQ